MLEPEKDKLEGLYLGEVAEVVSDVVCVKECTRRHAEWWRPCGYKMMSCCGINLRSKFIPWRKDKR